MKYRIFQVDSFTARPFGGNPAAVCLLTEPKEDGWMRNVAAEMNLPETAFVLKRSDGFGLRWFTPTVEVELCGHATLAAAHILWETNELGEEGTAVFHTLSGELRVVKNGGLIEMDFPSEEAKETTAPPELIEALKVSPVCIGRNRFDYLVEVESVDAVRSLSPDLSLLKKVKTRGVIVTSRSGEGYDFVSRFFAPGAGIDEDPVTGSAHCALGPYWAGKLGKKILTAYQASSRGGVVKMQVGKDRVRLSGEAVTVLRGELEA